MSEKTAKTIESQCSERTAVPNSDLSSFDDDLRLLEKLQAELASEESEEEPQYEEVEMTDEEMEALSDEELNVQIAVLKERMQADERSRELNQKALKLGMLKLANKAPRCAHIKSNGKPCKAPAYGSRPFCLFHFRAHEGSGAPAMRVPLLEDRESLLLAVKEIMERIVDGDVDPTKASLLLRSLQIANSTLKRKSVRKKRQGGKPVETNIFGNPVEDSA